MQAIVKSLLAAIQRKQNSLVQNTSSFPKFRFFQPILEISLYINKKLYWFWNIRGSSE